jgi:hypothetical protein
MAANMKRIIRERKTVDISKFKYRSNWPYAGTKELAEIPAITSI